MHFWALLLHSCSPDNRIFSSPSFCHILAGCVKKVELRSERFSPIHVAHSFFLAFCEDYPIPSDVLTAPDKLWC